MLKDDLIARGYLLGWKLVGRLPLGISSRLFTLGAYIASHNGKGMPQLRKNLARVVGPENVTRELVRDSVRSYARYWLEAFRLPSMAGDPVIVDAVDSSLVGKKALTQSVMAQPNPGTILVLPHTGNWDIAGMYLVNEFETFTTVAERLKPEVLYQAFVDYRTSLGFKVIPHEGGEHGPYSSLKKTLNDGGIIALLGERDLKKSGVEVQFFGETTRMPAGPARLALETGAALHVVHCWFTENGWGTSVSEPLEVTTLEETTQRIANEMEKNIAQHPQDWHMLQPLWLADLDQERYRQGLE